MQVKWVKQVIGTVIASFVFAGTVLAGDYSSGLQAYIDGDYQLAHQFWSQSARNNDAKSMFNLGLLHQKKKIPSANNEQAERWFQLAADNGYTAASFHLAQGLLERGGADDEALSLIRKSAQQGYVPAQRYLSASMPRRPSAPVAAKLVADDDQYQSEAWINSQRGSYWTIQLLAFKDRAKVRAFIDKHQINDAAAYFIEVKGKQVLYKLVYGSFSTKDKADFARQNMSKNLQEHGPWLRSIASVQAITKR